MFKVNQAQVQAFKQQGKRRFIGRVAAYLRENHAGAQARLPGGESITVAALSAPLLRSLVAAGVERGQRHGITWESNLTAFVVLMFLTAPNFDEEPTVRRILDDGPMDPDFRMDHLWEETTDDTWTAVFGAYDADGWGLREEAHDGHHT
jgi:hypothetical protein